MFRAPDSERYLNLLRGSADIAIDWDRLSGRTILIAGAAGAIASYFIDLIMYRNARRQNNIGVIALGRSEERLRSRFSQYLGEENFSVLVQDVNVSVNCEVSCDYIIHAASNTHPILYAKEPIRTIMTNVRGTGNLLELAARQNNCRMIFLSSVEIYGENRGDIEAFDEKYCGYTDCNTLRAGYPESKRTGEALCQAYISEKGIDCVMPRLSRVYGPTMSVNDSKAIAQFIKNALKRENIILKSAGTQLYSYVFTADAVSALLYILLYGEKGEAYTVASDRSNMRLSDIADALSDIAGTEVIFECPSDAEAKGYSTASKALLDTGKIKKLGWESRFDMDRGLLATMEILGEYRDEYVDLPDA
jgi:nucleoside-diphosphate-sugar epimerase